MNKEELLSLGASDVAPVELGGGKKTYVRSLSLEDVATAEKMIKDGGNALAVWTVFSACKEDGTRLFTVTDLAEVSRMPARISKAICEAAITHNGLGTVEDATDPN